MKRRKKKKYNFTIKPTWDCITEILLIATFIMKIDAKKRWLEWGPIYLTFYDFFQRQINYYFPWPGGNVFLPLPFPTIPWHVASMVPYHCTAQIWLNLNSQKINKSKQTKFPYLLVFINNCCDEAVKQGTFPFDKVLL